MTCIVGVEWEGGVVLGADSCGSAGGKTVLRADEKLYRVEQETADGEAKRREELLLGFTSSYRMGQILRWRLELPYCPAGMTELEYMQTRFVDAVRKALADGGWLEKKDERESAGHFLAAWRGRLYHVEGDLQVGRYVNGYDATGSGCLAALGSLHTSHEDHPAHEDQPPDGRARVRVKLALMAAEEHDAYVRRPFLLAEQARPDR